MAKVRFFSAVCYQCVHVVVERKGSLRQPLPCSSLLLFTHEPHPCWSDFSVLGRCGGGDAGELRPTISAQEEGAAYKVMLTGVQAECHFACQA